MRFPAFLRELFQGASPIRRCSTRKLSLESLEDRRCLSYTVIDLGTLANTVSSAASAVNESGQVVGSSANAAGNDLAFLWKNGNLTDLGTLGGPNSSADDINDAGQVVGGSYPAGTGHYHAFLWQEGVMTDLGTLANLWTRASAINNQGQIVGFSTMLPGELDHAFLWESGAMYDLNTLLPASSGWTLWSADDINDNGQIVGWGVINGQTHAFLMSDADGVYGNGGATITDIGTLPGGSSSFAHAVNNSGQVVGESTARRDVHAFLYSGDAVTDLKTLGGPHSWAYGINDARQVVGSSQYVSRNYSSPRHAFLWQNGKMVDLNKQLRNGSGWTLGGAHDINNAGWIVGGGAINGQGHAFLMVPGSALQAESVSTAAVSESLDDQQITPLFAEALARWQAAGVDTSSLGNLHVRIANLGSATLGLAIGDTIWLDDNAAGWGWFVDASPWDDSEFTTPGDQGEQGRMDLLTVLAHEIGHLLGFEHSEPGALATGDVMLETLAAGTRRMPAAESSFAPLDELFAAAALEERWHLFEMFRSECDSTSRTRQIRS